MCFASSQNADVYFLSENDFLAGHSVLYQEVRYQSYLAAEYSDDHRLISLSYYDEEDQMRFVEKFIYLKTGDLQKKHVFNHQNTLTEETIYGKEENARRFIEFVMGVDAVKTWGDRYTKTYFRVEDGQPTVHEFYDVDGYYYGNIGFLYDEEGNRTEQIWIQYPSRQVIRRWEYKQLVELGLFETKEYDGHGNIVEQFWEDSEGKEEALQFIEPVDSSIVSHSDVSYLLKNPLKQGCFLWIRKDAAGLSLDTTLFQLTTSIMLTGMYADVSTVALMDGAEYELQFSGVSKRGKEVILQSILPIRIDRSPPEVRLDISPFLQNPEIAFSTNEPLAYATLIWTPLVDGSPKLPLSVPFAGDDFLYANNGVFIPQEQQPLTDGVEYSVAMEYADLVGNKGKTRLPYPVRCDKIRPVVTIHSPLDSSYHSELNMTFSFSEDMRTAVAELFTPGDSAEQILLTDSLIVKGHHIVVFPLMLTKDSTMYTLRLSGMDLAGNVSDSIVVHDIHMDFSPPRVTLVSPQDGAYIHDLSLSFRLSENLYAGEFRWEQTSGKADPHSPHIVPLSGDEMLKGEKRNIELMHAPTLSEQSCYTLTFAGVDFAGNESELISIYDIEYDTTKPEITVLFPDSGASVSTTEVGLSISEDLKYCTISWVPFSEDVNKTSFDGYTLSEEYLFQSDSLSITLSDSDTLVSGEVYNLVIFGEDYAGNPSDRVVIPSVLYDSSLPEILVVSPIHNERMNQLTIEYTLSEDVVDGRIQWFLENEILPQKTKRLTNEFLLSGAHMLQIQKPENIYENTVYKLQLTGSDKAGNLCESIVENIRYDFTPPVILLTAPTEHIIVNHKNISYSISEPLFSGDVIWFQFTAEGDTLSVLKQKMEGMELSAGRHENIRLMHTPNLLDSAVYAIKIIGIDSTENQSESPMIVGITYDVTSPKLEFISPKEDERLSEILLLWKNSEDLSSGVLAFLRKSDDDSLRKVHLDSTYLTKGIQDYLLTEADEAWLKDGDYSICINGEDVAGNVSKPAIINHVVLDATPPIVQLLSPTTKAVINQSIIQFTNSEPLSAGELKFISIRGDTITQILMQNERREGVHSNSALSDIELTDSLSYRITYVGVDLTGNKSQTAVIDSIVYDFSPPLIQIENMVHHQWMNTPLLRYSLSEDIEHGTVVWADQSTGDSITFSMDSSACTAGLHEFRPQLLDGHRYSITIFGEDYANNAAEPVFVNDIRYDVTPPVFTNISIADSTSINSPAIGYGLSETMASAEVQFVGSDGRTFHVPLSIEGRSAGRHEPMGLYRQDSLSDGIVYDISFFGTDFAGNNSDTITVYRILYDVTPPTIHITDLHDDDWRNHRGFTYTLTEELSQGAVLWKDLTTLDEIEYHLSGDALKSGHHDILDYYQPMLTDGHSYSLLIRGKDLAGNSEDSVSIRKFTYDISPPMFSDLSFTDDSFVNDLQIGYSVSESLLSGTVEFTPAIGEAFQIDILGASPDISLGDGMAYSIAFFGEDSAGNSSHTLTVRRVIYDVSPPIITIAEPQDSTLYNLNSIRYSVNETLLTGEIIWRNETDSIRVDISDEDLQSGGHEINIANLSITENTRYSLTVVGQDKAGNIGASAAVENVVYDLTSPTVEYVSRVNDLPLNTIELTYTFSEDVEVCRVHWVPEDTTLYPVQRYQLEGDYLNEGEHSIQPEIELTDGVNYYPEFVGKDFAGNSVVMPQVSTVFRYDRETPVITVFSPQDSSFYNQLDIRYELSETLASGEIVFAHSGGRPDSDSLHIVHLKGSRLEKGLGGGVLPTKMVNLISGAEYMVTFTGIDLAGNSAEPVEFSAFHYDVVPPIISINKPISNSSILELVIAYTSSEALKEGNVLIQRTGGALDPQSPWELSLDDEHLSSGSHEINFSQYVQLKEGAIYSIELNGVDIAGNSSKPTTATNVRYDTTPPILEIYEPVNDTYVNAMKLSLSINELLQSGEIIVESEDGRQTVLLSDDERKAGRNDSLNITDRITFINGTVYNLKMIGSDFAGNCSDTVSVTQVTFDSIPPVLSISRPIDTEIIPKASIDYFCSETMNTLTATFTQTDGSRDNRSPHIITIDSDARSGGIHRDIKPPLELPLVESGIYTITLSGEDKAGNIAKEVEVQNILFDNKPPVLEFVSLKSDTALNRFALGYSTSEVLKNCGGVILQTGGLEDRKSPHEFSLTQEFLTTGIHENISLPSIKLQSGSIYSIRMGGKDLAGNFSDSISVQNILFDNIKPVITISAPVQNTLVIDPLITYELSEDVVTAKAVWLNGTKETGFVYEIDLVEEEMKVGLYQDILLQNSETPFLGLPFILTMSAQDRAGNVSEDMRVRNVTFTRLLDGFWKYAGILMQVSLVFTGDLETESQTGTMQMHKKMGTKIDETINGTYSIDYTKHPWQMDWELSGGEVKHCIFEFTGANQMRIVIGDKTPKNWNDGELLFFVFLPEGE